VAGRVTVARIGAAHGIKGEVRVKPLTEDPTAVAAYGPLETEDGRRLEIEALREAGAMLVVRFKGIADRNAAEALTGLALSVPRERLPKTDDDEFYHADLVGLAAVTADGAPLGTVVAVQNFGAGDLLEIAPPSGKSVFIPFTAAVVPEIDVAGGRVTVAPPPGLLDGETET
jgi:16S rRNA processing protein RimM